MHRYNAFSLAIDSAIELPELRSADHTTADLTIRRQPIDRAAASSRPPGAAFLAPDGTAYFDWSDLAAFEVRAGREIVVDPIEGVDERLVRLPLLGTVLAVALHQRGLFVLHASAVAVGDSAIVIAGPKGRGKSTLAAALVRRGGRLLTDDQVAIDASAPSLVVVPGPPTMKLWPESAASVGIDPASLPEIAPDYDKRSRRVSDVSLAEATPLAAVVVLEDGPETAVTQLPGNEAVLALIAHSYVSRYGGQLLTGPVAARHLAQCASIASRIPVVRLDRPRALDRLDEVAAVAESIATPRGAAVNG